MTYSEVVVDDILKERTRQQTVEGWTVEHDNAHTRGEMANAAACYARQRARPQDFPRGYPPAGWPWAPKWWKPKTRREDLVRAAALIVAEIERLDRAQSRKRRAR